MARAIVEDCFVLDASQWMREGILSDGGLRGEMLTRERIFSLHYSVDTFSWTGPNVCLTYNPQVGGTDRLSYDVLLQKTLPHFGGCRWWFVCPLSPNGFLCSRRVHKLFLPPGATYFGCRECYELTNKSRREDGMNRALRKARKIRVRLGGSGSFLDEFPSKPKGMWERTYRRLKGQAEDAENRATPLIRNWLEHLPEDPES